MSKSGTRLQVVFGDLRHAIDDATNAHPEKDGSPMAALTKALELPLHIHSIVSADGVHPLTTQIYFDGDPLAGATFEGPIPLSAVKSTELHDDPADYQARSLPVPYRTLTYDYVLRPAV